MISENNREDAEIKEYMMQAIKDSYRMSPKEYEEFHKLVLEKEEIAKEVIRETAKYDYDRNKRLEMIMWLMDAKRGEDVALEEARRLAFRLSFYRCMPRVERMVKNWIACKTDEMPVEWPQADRILMWGNRVEAYEVCHMSQVNEHMARTLIYSIMAGYPDYFREPLKEMLELWGIEHTRKFLNDMVERYQVDEIAVMEMYSAAFVLPWKSKLETQLYGEYIENWIKSDWDKYLQVITAMKKRCDMGKKIYNKVIKPRLEAEE